MKDVFFVAMQRRYKIVAEEVTPTNWALTPQTIFAH